MSVLSCSGPARQRGFTLIEALIAFVILSIGLLGIVSLQAMAKTSQHLAIQHTRAVTLADAIIERIRINPAGLATYNIGLNDASDGNKYSSEPSPDCTTDPQPCSPVQLADHDLWAWDQALEGAGAQVNGDSVAGLIKPFGCIVFSPAPDRARTGRLTVIIQWRGLHESSDAVPSSGDVCDNASNDAAAAGTDKFRRQVVSSTYVVDETEF